MFKKYVHKFKSFFFTTHHHLKNRVIILFAIFSLLFIITVSVSIDLARYYFPTILYLTKQTPEISSEEKNILDSVSKKITIKEFEEATKKAEPLAKKTEYIETGDCNLYPAITHARVNSSLYFRNSSKQIRFITFTKEVSFSLKPGETKYILLDFIHYVPSVVGFGCDSSTSPKGALYVTK